MIGGLVFLGFALQDLIPWIGTAFAWAIYVFGTVPTLYLRDTSPRRSLSRGKTRGIEDVD
jgi:hypothetical protein